MKFIKNNKILIALIAISAGASWIFVISLGIERYLLVVSGAMLGSIIVWLVVETYFILERKRNDDE